MLYHVTPVRNLEGIQSHGLQLSRSVGKPRIWLVRPSKIKWAIQHVMTRHNCEAVVVFSVKLNRQQITRYKRGIYFTPGDVPPELLGKE